MLPGGLLAGIFYSVVILIMVPLGAEFVGPGQAKPQPGPAEDDKTLR